MHEPPADEPSEAPQSEPKAAPASVGEAEQRSRATRATGVWVPPWVQLVGLPLLVVFGWKFASAADHALMVFLIAGLISLLLNPIVRRFTRRGFPRWLAVLVVFGVFALIIAAITFSAINLLVGEAQSLSRNAPTYAQKADAKLASIQHLLARHHVQVNLRSEGTRFLDQLEQKSSEISRQALDYGRGFVASIASALFNLVLVIVVTVYMLLDAPRIGRYVVSLFPPNSRVEQLGFRLEHSLVDYVRGQTMASIVMGVSAAIGLWVIGATGVWPDAQRLALVFGAIVAVTEFAPSIGPILGGIAPVTLALFHGVGAALVVLAFFLVMHQIEGHIVVPKLMGAAVGLHPLIVIFGVLAGAQIGGAGGILLALPLMAVVKQLVLFVRESVHLEPWPEDTIIVPPFGPSAAAAGYAAQRVTSGTAAAAASVAAHPTRGRRMLDRVLRRGAQDAREDSDPS